MRLYLSATFLLLSVVINAQNTALHWQTNLGGSNNEYGYATIAISDGGFVVVGSTQSNKDGDVPQSRAFSGVNGNDIWVVKTNNFGEILWSKTFGGSKDDIATSVIETKDNGLLVVGTSNSFDGDLVGNGNGSRGGLLVLKLKPDGSFEWKKIFSAGFSLGEVDFQKADGTVKPVVKLTPDGGYIIAASREVGLPTTGQDFWLTKLDATGKELWNNKFGGNQDDFVNDLIVCSDGGFLILGSTASSGTAIDGAGKGFMDMYIVKTNANGKIVWQKAFGGTNYDAAFSAVENTDKSFTIVGETNSTDGDLAGGLGLKDAIILKISLDGKIQSKNLYGGAGSDGFYSVQRTSEGKLVAFGYSNSKIGDLKPKSSAADAWIMRFEINGTVISQSMFGGADIDLARNAFPTNDGNFIVVGNSNSVDGDVEDNNGGADFWLMKTGNPLPITMKSFVITTTNEQFIKLTWETINETKAKSFGIDRSSDDKAFTEMTKVFASGNSTTIKAYEFIDKKPLLGKSFYRLKYSDDTGKEYIYKTLSISISALANEPSIKEDNYEISPNPIENNEFSLKIPTNSIQKVSLFNIHGKPVSFELEKTEVLSVKIQQAIPSGIYFLFVESKEKSFVKKVLVR